MCWCRTVAQRPGQRTQYTSEPGWASSLHLPAFFFASFILLHVIKCSNTNEKKRVQLLFFSARLILKCECGRISGRSPEDPWASSRCATQSPVHFALSSMGLLRTRITLTYITYYLHTRRVDELIQTVPCLHFVCTSSIREYIIYEVLLSFFGSFFLRFFL